MLVLSRATGEMVEIACPVDLTVKVIPINGEIMRPSLVASDEIDDQDEGIRQRSCNLTDRLRPSIAHTRGDLS